MHTLNKSTKLFQRFFPDVDSYDHSWMPNQKNGQSMLHVRSLCVCSILMYKSSDMFLDSQLHDNIFAMFVICWFLSTTSSQWKVWQRIQSQETWKQDLGLRLSTLYQRKNNDNILLQACVSRVVVVKKVKSARKWLLTCWRFWVRQNYSP